MKKKRENDAEVSPEIIENEEQEQADTQASASTVEITLEEAVELIKELQKKNEEYLDRVQRNMAEFDNFRKRTVKEKASMYDDGVSDTLTKLLPVLDNFERALSAAADKEDTMYKGIEMIYNQLTEVVLGLGVEHINCVGEVFDPNLHFAVFHEENSEYEENTVIEEMQKGYKYKEKVIRPSMVKVAN